MVDWDELRDTLHQRFELDLDGGDELAFTIDASEAGMSRAQRVMIRRVSAWDREIVEIRSAFGELRDHDPVELLATSLGLPLGAIALHGRFLVVIHRELLSDLTVDGALFVAHKVAETADALEARLGRDRF